MRDILAQSPGKELLDLYPSSRGYYRYIPPSKLRTHSLLHELSSSHRRGAPPTAASIDGTKLAPAREILAELQLSKDANFAPFVTSRHLISET